MLPEDHAAIAGLIARIESWPAALEQQQRAAASSLHPPPATADPSSKRPAVHRGQQEELKLCSSLRALPSRKSHMMVSALPQRPPVYTRRPTVGAHLGPGSHEVMAAPSWLGGDMAVREPSRPSHVFRDGKPRPLLPRPNHDPMRAMSGMMGIPDLHTLRREKAKDIASISFFSCVERFSRSPSGSLLAPPQDEMLRRLRLGQQRTGGALPQTPVWDPQTPAWDAVQEELPV